MQAIWRAGLFEPLRAERSGGFGDPSFDQFQIILPNPIFIHNIHNLLNKQRFLFILFLFIYDNLALFFFNLLLNFNNFISHFKE